MSRTNRNIQRASQSLATGEMVELFTIDLSTIGTNLRYDFTNAVKPCTFRGVTYAPAQVRASGFDYNGQGAFPQPKVSIGNATRIISSGAVLFADLVGARLYRIKTYREFLDDGATPDAEALYAVDIYDFEQKTSHDDEAIEWTLASAMDQEGRMLPGRVVLQGICGWRYRVWNGSAFVYTHVQCPYQGTSYWNAKDEPVTDPAKDRCSRRLTGCKLRFGQNAELPFGGFPGVARIRI